MRTAFRRQHDAFAANGPAPAVSGEYVTPSTSSACSSRAAMAGSNRVRGGVRNRNHALTAGGAGARGVLRQKPPDLSACQAMGSHRASAKASHSAHSNIAALYHHNDSDKTQGVGNTPGA